MDGFKKWQSKNLDESFRTALRGLLLCLRNERNARLILLLGIFSFVLGIYLKISSQEFILLCLTIFLVFIAESLNTLVEFLLDAFLREENRYARLIKDISAGVVLLACIFSLIAGYFIFLKRIALLWKGGWADSW